jgi:hypothetical protein
MRLIFRIIFYFSVPICRNLLDNVEMINPGAAKKEDDSVNSAIRQYHLFDVVRTVIKYCDLEGNSIKPDVAVKKVIYKFDQNDNCIGTTVTLNPCGFPVYKD